jgi:hypothetical protein
MAKQVEQPIKAGASNKTPPQTHRVRDANDAYGQNGYSGFSSTTPGNDVSSPLADNLKLAQDPHGHLDTVIQKGARTTDVDPQSQGTVRSAKPFPLAHGMGKPDGSPSGKVPSILDKSATAKPS